MSSNQAAIAFELKHSKREPRAQFAALCYRRNRQGKIRLLLITGRRTGRWKLPKGWPTTGLTPAQTAVKEAYEEAGVRGKPHQECVGHYNYVKSGDGDLEIPCIVAVFPVKVSGTDSDFPETGERKIAWLPPKKAAKRVDEPSLRAILENFDPSDLRN